VQKEAEVSLRTYAPKLVMMMMIVMVIIIIIIIIIIRCYWHADSTATRPINNNSIN